MKEKYISRVDSFKSGMFGYLLRLYKGRGVLFQQWFSDKEYGGKAKALDAAIKIRDRKMVEYNYKPGGDPDLKPWKPVLHDRKVMSNTGYLGIYESKEYKKLKDGSLRECPYIAVSYVEERGKPKSKKFYIGKKRTREQALEEAIKFRSAKEISARAAAIEYNREVQKRMIEEENKIRARVKRRSSK